MSSIIKRLLFTVSFLIIILINNNIAIGQQGNIEVYNIVTEGVDPTNADIVIQRILDEIKTNMGILGGGGIVYLPPGTYTINNTLKIPPRTVLMGMGGSFNLSGDSQGSYFIKHQSVVLDWRGEEDKNMIESYENVPFNSNTLESVVIQGIALNGNATAQHGIYLPNLDEGLGAQTRSGLIVRETLIYNMKGNGFHAGQNQSEIFLEKVCSYKNGGNGFKFISGSDINLTSVWAGGNIKDGFYFESVDNVRSFNCDAWGNDENGAYISNSAGFSFHKFQSNDNDKNGIVIINSPECSFLGSFFVGNSALIDGEHSEIYIIDSYGIKFVGCRIGSHWSSNKTKWGIYDSSAEPATNSIIGCSIYEAEFLTGTFSSNVLGNYLIEGCTGGASGKDIYKNPNKFVSTNLSPFHINKSNETIIVDTETGWKQLKLPLAADVNYGKEYLIVKKLADNMKILITPSEGDNINNLDVGTNFEYVNTNANGAFRIIKVSESNWIVIE